MKVTLSTQPVAPPPQTVNIEGIPMEIARKLLALLYTVETPDLERIYYALHAVLPADTAEDFAVTMHGATLKMNVLRVVSA